MGEHNLLVWSVASLYRRPNCQACWRVYWQLMPAELLLQGLDAAGLPLPGGVPANAVQRDVAVSAVTCCNPSCLALAGPSEAQHYAATVVRNRCSRCKQTRYCGRECQAADWPRHRKVCKHMHLL